MSRAPYQVLVLPYRIHPEEGLKVAVFKRQPDDGDFWQFVAGGGEGNETREEAARREMFEETGVAVGKLLPLKSKSMVPASVFSAVDWGPEITEIPEYCFAVEIGDSEIVLSSEHTEFRWVDFDEAIELLHWESNCAALRELQTLLK
ncbi:MAG TPA: NUDIX pyrophosphatase [candidate division Zixibacteria bacterium]|nr:NUDIX pyrophosphatase [candidate division Zixibacteria bacterium]